MISPGFPKYGNQSRGLFHFPLPRIWRAARPVGPAVRSPAVRPGKLGVITESAEGAAHAQCRSSDLASWTSCPPRALTDGAWSLYICTFQMRPEDSRVRWPPPLGPVKARGVPPESETINDLNRSTTHSSATRVAPLCKATQLDAASCLDPPCGGLPNGDFAGHL